MVTGAGCMAGRSMGPQHFSGLSLSYPSFISGRPRRAGSGAWGPHGLLLGVSGSGLSRHLPVVALCSAGLRPALFAPSPRNACALRPRLPPAPPSWLRAAERSLTRSRGAALGPRAVVVGEDRAAEGAELPPHGLRQGHRCPGNSQAGRN